MARPPSDDSDQPLDPAELAAMVGVLRQAMTRPVDPAAIAEAQEIMYEAWEADTAERAVALTMKAIGASPHCCDAYVLLGSIAQGYDGGRWWTQISQAGAQKEAAEGQLKEQQMASELEATRRFYTLLKAQLTLKVLEETVRRSGQQLENARSLYEAGRGQRSAARLAQ